MKLQVEVKVQGTLTVDERAAEIINHLTGYNFAHEFAKYFSGRFTAEEIAATLNALHCQTAQMLSTRKAVMAAAVNHAA